MAEKEAMAALLSARALLDAATPLKKDCGRLCGAACCAPDTDGQSGMYLFYGEEALYEPAPPWAHIIPTDWKAAGRTTPLLVCDGTCPRGDRPLACRIFPLIARAAGGGFALGLDPRGWAVCPLMSYGMRGLDPAFVAAARGALELLWAVPEHRAYLQALDALLAEYEAGFC